jgi:hypothetical protein
VLVFVLSAVPTLAQGTPDDAAYSLGGSGLPVEALVIYTPETDPNHLLGRPGQYTGKISWHDVRAGDMDTTDLESTVEFYPTLASLQSRATYLQKLSDASATIFGQYLLEDDSRLLLMHLPFALTPDQVAEYQTWLGTL